LSLILDEHRLYLSDKPRIAAFRKALQSVVKPTDVVLDLGCGTGIMGLLACEAGAARVYSIDEGGIIEMARAFARANGFQDRMNFICGYSKRVNLPEKVDIVVADQIGRFGFEAGVLDFYEDARRRLLKPGGRLIPDRIDMVLAPVEVREMWDQIEFWTRRPAGFSFEPGRQIATNTGYPTKYKPENLLGKPAKLISLDLQTATGGPVEGRIDVSVDRRGMLHGLAGWFEANLAPGVTLTNSPLSPDAIMRNTVYFPIDRAVEVEKGDRINVLMRVRPNDFVVSWNVEVFDPSGSSKARFAHSTLKGMLISKEDLQRTRPQSVPRLNPWGVARHTLLNLCDGKKTLSEIEQEVYRAHQDLFRSLDEAASFVSEVVTRYSL
jgi:hypothetical protein